VRDVVGIRVWVWVQECEQGGGGGWGGKGPFGVLIWQGLFSGQKQLGPRDTARKRKEET
jgi:hypothetical protein